MKPTVLVMGCGRATGEGVEHLNTLNTLNTLHTLKFSRGVANPGATLSRLNLAGLIVRSYIDILCASNCGVLFFALGTMAQDCVCMFW